MSASNNPVGSIVEETNTITVKVPTETGGLTFNFTIDGQVKPNQDFEITENEDNSIRKNNGTVKAVNIIGGPNGVDSFDYRGKVVDAQVPDAANVYLNGQQVSVQNLLDYYKGNNNNGGNSGDDNKNGGQKKSAWDNPWVLVSAAGVAVSGIGIVQRQMSNNNGGR